MVRQRSSSLTGSTGMELDEMANHDTSKHLSLELNTQIFDVNDPRPSSDDTDLEDVALLAADETIPTTHTRTLWSKLRQRHRLVSITALLSLATVALLSLSASHRSSYHSFAHAPQVGPSWQGFPAITHYFAFGDSWTTTHFWCAGEQPSLANPLGNPSFPGYTSSNGINYIGYLATKYNQSYISAYSLAYAGSVIDSSIDFTMLDWLDFPHQLNEEFLQWYMPSPKQKANWTSSDTLFSAFFGINDLIVYNRTTHRIKDVFATYENSLQALFENGARNFLLLNIPPIDEAPAVTEGHTKKYQDVYRKELVEFNGRLLEMAARVRKWKGVTLFVYDVHELFERVMNKPDNLELTRRYKDTRNTCKEYRSFEMGMVANQSQIEACKGLDWDEYLWLNHIHVTPPVHEAMASEIAKILGDTPAWTAG